MNKQRRGEVGRKEKDLEREEITWLDKKDGEGKIPTDKHTWTYIQIEEKMREWERSRIKRQQERGDIVGRLGKVNQRNKHSFWTHVQKEERRWREKSGCYLSIFTKFYKEQIIENGCFQFPFSITMWFKVKHSQLYTVIRIIIQLIDYYIKFCKSLTIRPAYE